MSKKTFGTAILAIGVLLCAGTASAQSAASVTGAGAATLKNAITFNGVNLTSLKFGLGAPIAPDGTAAGDFESTLIGTASGQPRTITLEGKPTSGSGRVGATTTLTGTCRLNMGDGSPVQVGVPFTLVVVPTGKGSVTLTVAGTNFPVANLSAGSLTVR